ncbi:MAG TPA: tol-pal system protein YbgF [Thiobacillaceae bacterium]|nr:tol-pal system protein YbgF [Thiobacillaceae bacterium]HNU64393.1 tol-pal system protein YbgF [Thiobacillaceae bacterium]
MKANRAPFLLLALAAQACWAAPGDEQVQRLSDLLKAQEQRLGRLESQLQNQGLLNLLNQVEALKAEVARLRGAQDELAYRQEVADKRVKDLFVDVDERLKELESRPAVVAQPVGAMRLQPAQTLTAPPVAASTPAASGVPPQADAEGEARAYESAYQMVKAGRYKEAVLALQAFVKAYPKSGLVPNAHYWTGFSYVGMSDFESAELSYQHLIDEYPNSAKAADAMLSLARAQVQMNKRAEAMGTLERLAEKFPYSRAADSGKKLLSTLR